MIALSVWALSGPWIAHFSASRIVNFHWEDAPHSLHIIICISLSLAFNEGVKGHFIE